MRFALRNRFSGIAFVAAAMSTMFAQAAFADSAFITQAGKGGFAAHPAVSNPVPPPSSFPFTPPHGGMTQVTPETTVPATGGNFASTLEMGRNNFVLQAQSGAGNFSNVGILGGKQDNVGVFQHGQGLFTNLWLVNMQGAAVDVIQPPGSAPVNMLIAKLPNGALLIKR